MFRGRESRGYCEDQGSDQLLIKRWKWRGITIWKRILDHETIPMDVLISVGALGFYDGPWRSKFQDIIERQRAARA